MNNGLFDGLTLVIVIMKIKKAINLLFSINFEKILIGNIKSNIV